MGDAPIKHPSTARERFPDDDLQRDSGPPNDDPAGRHKLKLCPLPKPCITIPPAIAGVSCFCSSFTY